MFEGFKKFILRGNVVDLAVGVVVGAAFNSVVQAFVKDLLTPLIGIAGGTPNFSAWSFSIRNSTFMIGDFINNIVSFLIIAAVVYFLVVKPINKLMSFTKKQETPSKKVCPECFSDIPIKATRCPYCTSILKPQPIK
jgi:large conductance mechanosensitive channel